MIGIEKELLIFLTAFSSGIEDLFYWIFVEMYLFVQIYHTSSGSVRWYYILGVVVGACLMSWLLQKVKKMCKKIYTRKT